MVFMKSKLRKVTFIGGLFSFVSAIDAADKVVQETPVPLRSVDPLSLGSISQMLVALLFVLVMIVVVAWLLKRSGRLTGLNKGRMKILEVASLGAREKAVLMEVDDTKILVGVAPGQMNVLHVFSENDKSFEETLVEETAVSGMKYEK